MTTSSFLSVRKLAISTALAIVAGCIPANATVVMTGVLPAGATVPVANPTSLLIGGQALTLFYFRDDTGPTTQGISWQIERLPEAVGPVPAASDFLIWQQMPGMGGSAGPVTMTFDGVKTYTFTVQTPTPTYVYPDGSAIYNYFLTSRYPTSGEYPYGDNERAIIFSPQSFKVVTVPETSGVILGGVGLLALLRRRR